MGYTAYGAPMAAGSSVSPFAQNNSSGLFQSGRVVSVTPNQTQNSLVASGGGGGASGGLDSGILKKLLASLSGQSADAKSAQNQQYSDLMGSVGDTKSGVLGAYDSASGLLANQGASSHQQVADNLQQQNAHSEQDLINRGLGNTTIRSSVMRGNDTAAQKANQSIDENVASQQAGVLQNKAGALQNLGNLSADSILSKQIQGPDISQYLSLLQALGGNSGAMGGSGKRQATLGVAG